jgi:hypothetical protein
MNRHSKGARRRPKTIQIWTYAQAKTALPYVTSIMRSLREQVLEAQHCRLRLHRLTRRPGRLDRAALIAQDEIKRQAGEAEDRIQEAIEELLALDIYCLDPIRGEAVIPFVRDDQLAWYLYDLFDDRHLVAWRFDSEAQETCRPLTESETGAAEGAPPSEGTV